MTTGIKALLPYKFKNKLRKLLSLDYKYGIHYSQSAEDLLVSAIINSMIKIENGFYIDVGSFHPTISSNTHLLYMNGWSGINIDPRPGSKSLFDSARKRDTNLEVGVGSVQGTMKYYFISDSSALNSFSKATIEENGALDQISKILDCPVVTMDHIIKTYVPQGKEIDFLNIDAEGFEVEILSTIDWEKNRPKIIAMEQNQITTLQDVLNSETNSLMESKNYRAVIKNIVTRTVATVIYVDKKYL